MLLILLYLYSQWSCTLISQSNTVVIHPPSCSQNLHICAYGSVLANGNLTEFACMTRWRIRLCLTEQNISLVCQHSDNECISVACVLDYYLAHAARCIDNCQITNHMVPRARAAQRPIVWLFLTLVYQRNIAISWPTILSTPSQFHCAPSDFKIWQHSIYFQCPSELMAGGAALLVKLGSEFLFFLSLAFPVSISI